MERSTAFVVGICLLIGAQSTSSSPVINPSDVSPTTTEKPLPDLGYLAIAPKHMIMGTSESVCIHLLSFDLEDPIEVLVVLMDSDNVTELSSAPLYVMGSQHECVRIQVPDSLEDYSIGILKIQMRHMFAATSDFEVIDLKKVQIRSIGPDTFIQTDKPIYKPGQTVFFRIMTLDQELKPDTSPFSEIWIEAPSGSRLAQWKNEKTDDGLIDLNMPMTSEPQLGEWKIVAIQNGKKTEQTFKVDEYVLPKFEVVVTTPPFVLINAAEFEVEVCGVYTYGQPVEGSFSGVIKVKTEGYEYRPRPVVAIEPQETGKSGCGTIMVNASHLNLDSTDHSIWNAHIYVDVDFTETNTGVSISESAKAGKISSDALLLDVLAPSTFKPGVPYFGQVEVKFPDNSPAGGQFIRMSAKTNDGEIFEKNYTSPANGLIEFEVPDIAIDSDKLEIYAWAPGHGNDDGTYDYRVYSIYDPATTFYVKPRYSPSGSFMQMSPIREQVSANSEQTIDIYYTSDLEENVEELFTFVFMARGDILDVPVERIQNRRRRESPPGPVIDNERVGSCPPVFDYEDTTQACSVSCNNDYDCASNEKCCDANCPGGSMACLPLIIIDPPVRIPIKIHRGECPVINETVGVDCEAIQFSCEHDGECQSDQKCCSSDCGTKCAPAVVEPKPTTKCQQAVLDAGEQIPGKYIPQCTETGEYEVMQCHSSTGFCWCVNTEGEELLETRQRFSRPECEPAVVEPECPDFCAEIYTPVCGTDARTYSNICSLKQAACQNSVDVKFDYDGECVDPEVHCPLVCTLEFAPVCGSDGHSYPNACELRSTRLCVEGNEDLTLVSEGSCEDAVTTTQDPLIGHVGECPPVDEVEAMVGVCADLCTQDNECNDTQRCCPTFCGGRSCLSTIQIQPPEPDCPVICPAIYSPVCGSDAETYPSSCDLRAKACRENSDLFLDYYGECQPDVEIATPGQLKKMQRKFLVTPDMSPVIRVMAYYIRPDGEVIADAMTIKVQPTFENQVNINFAEREAKPGSTTQLTVSAAPNSLCALGIVDKSVHVLGGDNTISKDKVFSALEKYQLSEAGGQVEWSSHCPNSYPWWWRGGFRRKRSYLLPTPGTEYDDASRSFQDMGLVFLSNLDVETRPCSDPYAGRGRFYYKTNIGDIDGQPGPVGGPVAMQIPVANMQVDEALDESLESIEESSPTETLRSYFPETWLWNLERTGPTGSTTVDLKVPHTITEWISNGFCTSFEAGLGVSSTSGLKAFQPFFVSLTLPYSVIRGESVPILATIFNYLDQCLVIEATYVEDERMPLADATKRVQQVCVCGGDSKSITFQVVPDALGDIPIRVDAASVADTNLLCGNDVVASDVRATDAIEKELLVEAEGVEQEISHSNYVCPEDFVLNTYYERIPLLLPNDYVPGSERAKVQVTGDMMGPTLNNLENLVQRPYGCGEQNMLGFVPNIQVMRYLTSTDQLTDDIETRAKNNMKMGYQRELNYRREDGSYSAFGDSDPEGSTWLTAFVMWSFAQASDYIEIDEKDLNVSLNWLRQQQDVDGCFISVGQVHHKAMKGGVNNGVTLSAYVLMAMLEGGIEAEDPAVVNVIECLHKSVDTLSDTYTAAQMAYALALAGSDKLDDVMDKLESLATEEGGFKFWESNREDIPKEYTYGYQAPQKSQDIEMTAYALLAYIVKYGRDALTEGNSVARWIIQKRNPEGGFSSTQDTIVALQALSEYAAMAYKGGVSMNLNIKIKQPYGLPDAQIEVTEDNRLLQQEVEVPVPSVLVLRGRGSGCSLVQVTQKFNIIPEPPTTPPFNLRGDWTAGQSCDSFSIRVCTSYTGPDGASNMALVQIKMVSGFYPKKASLTELKDAGIEGFRRAEFEKKTVNIYFDKLTAEEVCFSFNVFRDIVIEDPKPGVISVTDYYEKDMTVSMPYEIRCVDRPLLLEEPFLPVEPLGPLPGPPGPQPQLGRVEAIDGENRNKEPCEKPCSREYRPHCGTDGVTYSNKCLLDIAICKDPSLKLDYEEPCRTKGCVDNNGVEHEVSSSWNEDKCMRCTCMEGGFPACMTPACMGPPSPDCVAEDPSVCCPKWICPTEPTAEPSVPTAEPLPQNTESCEKPCSREYRPHCGTDGVTYSNKCLLDIAICKDPSLKLDYEEPCRAKEQVPDAPQNVVAITESSTSVLVSWDPPSSTFGNIVNYHLFYADLGTGQAAREQEVPVTETSYTVQGLDPYTRYGFRVEAFNENGPGPSSGAVEARTFTDIPGAPPTDVTAIGYSASSVLLRWNPPPSHLRNGDITGYNIRYRTLDNGGRSNRILVDGVKREYLLSDLMRDTAYEIRIAAVNINGTGPSTDVISSRTLPDDLNANSVCEQDPNICGDNGLCRNTDNGHTCDCLIGYAMNDQGQCQDEDECQMAPGICGEYRICTNVPGSYICNCIEGYELDVAADICVDADECAANADICGDNSLCINTRGSYTCTCAEGFSREGEACIVKCPVCAQELPSGWESNYCQADFVYVTKVRNDGQLRLLHSVSAADGEVVVEGRRYVRPEWDDRCSCDTIIGGARLLVIGYSQNHRTDTSNGKPVEVIHLDSNSYIVDTSQNRDDITRVQPNC